MRIIIFFTLFFLISCGYPDIDSVPSFEDLKLTEQEIIDLCQLSSTDKDKIDTCIKEKQKTNEKY